MQRCSQRATRQKGARQVITSGVGSPMSGERRPKKDVFTGQIGFHSTGGPVFTQL